MPSPLGQLRMVDRMSSDMAAVHVAMLFGLLCGAGRSAAVPAADAVGVGRVGGGGVHSEHAYRS